MLGHGAKSEIKNGYEKDLALANQSLQNVRSVLNTNKDASLTDELKRFLTITERKRNKLYRKYYWTQALLDRFRSIDPQTFATINAITDYEGNATDVYVRVVTRGEMQTTTIAGVTNLAQSSASSHCYRSVYGDRSVSVNICYGTQLRLLKTLAHEFGHVRYQVPNLRSYIEYYKISYAKQSGEGRGHNLDDPSHRSVQATMKEFRSSRKNYIRKSKYAVAYGLQDHN